MQRKTKDIDGRYGKLVADVRGYFLTENSNLH
jgi:hypothetical protein